jgi:hypothetical protein
LAPGAQHHRRAGHAGHEHVAAVIILPNQRSIALQANNVFNNVQWGRSTRWSISTFGR